MADNQKPVPASGMMVLLLVLANVIFISDGYTDDSKWYGFLIITLPMLIWAIIDARRANPSVERIDNREAESKISSRHQDGPGAADETLIAAE
jgi:hypothetical protein